MLLGRVSQRRGVLFNTECLLLLNIREEGGKNHYKEVRVSALKLPSGLGRKQGWWLWADNVDLARRSTKINKFVCSCNLLSRSRPRRKSPTLLKIKVVLQ